MEKEGGGEGEGGVEREEDVWRRGRDIYGYGEKLDREIVR
jgi:hypothetical protein